MPLLAGASKRVIAANIERLIAEGNPPDQAAAIAHAVAKRKRDAASRRRMPPTQPPTRLEKRYHAMLLERVRAAHRGLIEQIAPLLLQADEARGDGVRRDNIVEQRILAVVAQLRTSFAGIAVEKPLERLGTQLDLFTTAQIHNQIRAVTTIAAFPDNRARQLSERWVRTNVELITSLDQRYFDDIERVVASAFRDGKATSALRAEIEERFGVSKSRAEFIARDQVAKLGARVREYRHKQLGISKYRWSASGDERVRSRHQELDGKVFRYDDPPVINNQGDRGNPGDDYQCFVPSTPVRGRFIAGIRSYYSGTIVIIQTRTGAVLTVTCNHPVLTSHGWVAARLLSVGDQVLRYTGTAESTTAEAAYEALARAGGTYQVNLKSKHIHGDGASVRGESEIVRLLAGIGSSPKALEVILRASSLETFGLLLETGEIVRDSVVSVRQMPYSGHVYDFQTPKGVVIAGDLVASNCRCVAEPILPDDSQADLGE